MIDEHFQKQKNPLGLAKTWFEKALARPVKNPNAVVVATVAKGHHANSRVVLIKEVTNKGFIFYTNYNSAKGKDISQNNKVCLNFFWDDLYLQMIVRGRAVKTSRAQSVKYWNSRQRASQISQCVSQQSTPVQSREQLDQLYVDFERQMEGKVIRCPRHWGGYLVIPSEIEFWEGQAHRFHNRVRFSKRSIKNKSSWLGQRLYP